MKTLFAALALATLGTGAFATEATQFDDQPAPMHSRAEIRAQSARLSEQLGRNIGEATVFVEKVESTSTRADVRAAARALGRTGPGLSYGEAVAF
jgi:hypothetical protein